MTEQRFREIVSGYEGSLSYSHFDGKLTFSSKNTISAFYTNGKVWRSEKVQCTVSLCRGGAIMAEEDTCSILGGQNTGKEATDDDLIKILERYKFKKKSGYVQMPLF